MSFPIVTSNVDAIIKHQAKFVSSSSDIVISGDKRKVLLSAITTGASVGIGPGGSTSKNFGLGDTSETNFVTVLENIPILLDSVIIKIDDVQIAIDDGAGAIVGDPTPGDISAGTIDYATGDLDITFSSAPALDAVISATYSGFDAALYRNIVGVAPFDLSAFLKNAPYSISKENMGLIISPAVGELITIAYIELKG
jgi:hypothetical protein